MTIVNLISYLNDEKLNLTPAFQRGHVWKLKDRRALVRNVFLGRPIPAVFLYKEAAGSTYTYNILDGKQRLESLMLFIADGHHAHKIKNWGNYFYESNLKKDARFQIDSSDYQAQRRAGVSPTKRGKVSFADLPDEDVREFMEYSIPTIEISLTDDTHIDEMISLFVDINQQGEPVKRFDIVKAMYREDPLMMSVFNLLAEQQKRKEDMLYKIRSSVFTRVLRQLQVVKNASNQNAQVDRMWERLLEIALFARHTKHRSAIAILRDFIAPKSAGSKEPKLSGAELARLRATFAFIAKLLPRLSERRLLTDQTHSYTLITALIGMDLVRKIPKTTLTRKILAFAEALDAKQNKLPKATAVKLEAYRAESTKQTTHVSRRVERDRLFAEIIEAL